MTDGHEALRSELKDVDELLAKLTGDEAALLATLIRAKRVGDRRALESSVDETLSVLPRLIRIPARKIMFGK